MLHFKYPCLLALLLATAGCGPQTVPQRLLGRWQGRPDTVAAQDAREPIPAAPGYQDAQAAEVASQIPAAVAAMQPSKQTDLEQFSFVVSLDFQPEGKIEMQLNGGQALSGDWQILSTDVGISQIEISVPSDQAETPIRRRYALKLNKAGDAFTLREEGIDPRFGWLYFTKSTGNE